MRRMRSMKMKGAVVARLFAVATVLVSAQGVRQVSLVIADGIVVTIDGNSRVLNPGSVAVDGTDIVAGDTPGNIRRQVRGRRTIDAAGPGGGPRRVHTHTH